MLVIVNPQAAGGTALHKWHALLPLLYRHTGTAMRFVVAEAQRIRQLVSEALDRGERRFVAAGGDGTVNLVLSALVDHGTSTCLRSRPLLGAVGLGSSNDFHKPSHAEHRIGGVPVRLDFDATVAHDVGLLEYDDVAGSRTRRSWLLNASIGITAEANRHFSEPDRLMRALKQLTPSAAMGYAALWALAGRRARRMTLTIDDRPAFDVPVANLGIVKNPHFAGRLRYDSPHEPGSGSFYVHLLDDARFTTVVDALWQLARGRFMQSGTGRSWRAVRIGVRADEPFGVECDGEVVTARAALFSLLSRRLEVCS